MSGNIEIIARGVCTNGDRVLLCHTEGATNTYLPGGHIEFGEGARESLAREIMEELGVVSTVGHFMGAIEHGFVQKGKPHCEINLVFRFEAPMLPVDRAPDSIEGHIDFQWAALDELDTVRLEPAPLRTLLPEWLSGKAKEAHFGSTLE